MQHNAPKSLEEILRKVATAKVDLHRTLEELKTLEEAAQKMKIELNDAKTQDLINDCSAWASVQDRM